MFTLYYTNEIMAETIAAELRCCGFVVTISFNSDVYQLDIKEK